MSVCKAVMPKIDKALVQQSFDLASTSYHQFTGLQRLIGDRLIEQRKESVSEALTVLDVGSGTGYLTRKLSQTKGVEHLYALDISTAMLSQTKLNTKGLNLTARICADAEQLPLQSASVDAVYSNLAYQWCSELQQAFDESNRVLRQQGVFAFSTFGEKTLFELKNAWRSVDQAVHVNTFIDQQTIERYVEKAGFSEIVVCSEDIVMHYQTPLQLMLELKGMGAHNINPGRNVGLTGVRGFKGMMQTYESTRTEKGIPATFQAVYGYAKK